MRSARWLKSWTIVLLGCAMGVNAFAEDTATRCCGERRTTKLVDWTLDGRSVTIPHTWNAADAADGDGVRDGDRGGSVGSGSYLRCAKTYSRKLPKARLGRRYFIRCEAVSVKATVKVNGQVAGRHVGAFTAFACEVTKFLDRDSNILEITADNTYDRDVTPISGDFSVFGGIYRDVWLVETPETCISPLVYGGPGVEIATDPDKGEVCAKIHVLGGADETRRFVVPNFRLWSPECPVVYTQRFEIVSGDAVDLAFGFAKSAIDDVGFSLNGQRRQIRGANLHQDRDEIGWAIDDAHKAEDIAWFRKMGADGIRTAHYPHSQKTYDLCDEQGLMVWLEMPVIEEVEFSDAFRRNLLTLAKEMVAQYRHHPSVMTWSICNEIFGEGGRTLPEKETQALMQETMDVVRGQDASRPIVSATCDPARKALNELTDAVGYNLYPGWYNFKPWYVGDGGWDLSNSIRRVKAVATKWKTIAVSEYGGGGCIDIHGDPLVRCEPGSVHQTEEYEAYLHWGALHAVQGNPEVWGIYPWNMFDFAADVRQEGHRRGINTKGLVTYDRQTAKDAFYVYKANWNPEPELHLVGKRMTTVDGRTMNVMAICNVGDVTLKVNGKTVGVQTPDRVKCCLWRDVELVAGDNVIEVFAKGLAERCVWRRVPDDRLPAWSLAQDLPLDNAHAFEVPASAIEDSSAFVVEMKIAATEDRQRRQLVLLDQSDESGGWALRTLRWNAAGNGLYLKIDGTEFDTGPCPLGAGDEATITLAVRDGLVRVYVNGRPMKRFRARLKPSRSPIRVGKTKLRNRDTVREIAGLRLKSLKFYGPARDYVAPGERRPFADAFRGGEGWLMNCPEEDSANDLPRILCFGDETMAAYLPALRERMKEKAHVYFWEGFVSSPDGDFVTKYMGFEDAAGVAKFDHVFFNNGHHALHWSEEDVNDEKVRLTQRAIARSFKEWCPTARLTWIANVPAASPQDDRIVQRINRISDEVMAKEQIDTIDGYSGRSRLADLVCEKVFPGSVPAEPLVDLVNPMIGVTASSLNDNNIHGLGKTFPGAACPHGIVQLSPDTVTGGDCAGGYDYNHGTIEGFSFTHMSGTGWYGDFGNIQVMPMCAEGYRRPASRFSHDREFAEAGYYRVFLDDPGVQAEMTCSTHAGMLRLTYPDCTNSQLTIDFARRIGEINHPKIYSGQEIEIVSPTEFKGEIYCDHRDGGWGHGFGDVDYTLYFHAISSRPLEKIERIGGESNAVFKCNFPTTAGETVTLHVALSFDGIPDRPTGFDFDGMRRSAKCAWAEAIDEKVAVRGGTRDERIIFATALYHAMIDPRPIGRGKGYTQRTIFSGWDVFHSLMPFFTIVKPSLVRDTVLSVMDVVARGDSRTLPSWEFFGCNTDVMNGNAIIPVMATLTEAGVTDFDTKAMYEMAKATSALKGNLPCGYTPGELATTLEYCFDDACMALLAKRFGTPADVDYYSKRAMFYTNCWDVSVGWMRSRRKDGGWLEPWEGRETQGQGCLESNPYHQGWVVPHDLEGLAKLMGGREKFIAELETFFEKAPDDFRWNDAYNHPNKSTQCVPYMFAAMGRPDLTYKWTRRICKRAYGTGVHGLCGNEDEGQMSAWYVLSAVGLHPVAPGDGKWYLTAPLFREARLKLDPKYAKGGEFTLRTHGDYREGCRCEVRLNGVRLDRPYVTTAEIYAGGVVEFLFF